MILWKLTLQAEVHKYKMPLRGVGVLRALRVFYSRGTVVTRCVQEPPRPPPVPRIGETGLTNSPE